MIDCRELDSVNEPSAFCIPKRSMKSGIIKHPYGEHGQNLGHRRWYDEGTY